MHRTVVGVWARIYKMQLGSHGMGAATSIAMSGIEMALWDIRGKGGRLACLQAARRILPADSRLRRRSGARLSTTRCVGR